MEHSIADKLLKIDGFEHRLLSNQEMLNEVILHERICPICTSEYLIDNIITKTPCTHGHFFHYGCILGSLTNSMRGLTSYYLSYV